MLYIIHCHITTLLHCYIATLPHSSLQHCLHWCSGPGSVHHRGFPLRWMTDYQAGQMPAQLSGSLDASVLRGCLVCSRQLDWCSCLLSPLLSPACVCICRCVRVCFYFFELVEFLQRDSPWKSHWNSLKAIEKIQAQANCNFKNPKNQACNF